jgi:CubicO group peptidase (beta-lactamase class C family)
VKNLLMLSTLPLLCSAQIQAANLIFENKLDALLEETRIEHEIRAMSVAIIDDGEVLYLKGFGFTDDEKTNPVSELTTFRIASISKLFTAQAIMQLVEKDKLSLDTKIGELLPAFGGSDINIRQLLTHSSGLKDRVRPMADGQRNVQQFLEATIAANKGAALSGSFNYADTNFNILGEIIHRVSGEHYSDYVEKHVLRPAGMIKSGFGGERGVAVEARPFHANLAIPKDKQRPYDRSFYPCEGLVSNAADLSQWIRLTMAKNPSILSSGSYQAMLVPQLKTTWGEIHMGLAWQVYDSDRGFVARHAGEVRGYKSLLITYPADEQAIIILTNSSSAPRWEIAALIENALDGAPTAESR